MRKILEIWQPRYKDNVVLIAKFKVCKGENLITFTKAKHLEGMVFSVEEEAIRSCPLQSNGKIDCYAVPMELLTRKE